MVAHAFGQAVVVRDAMRRGQFDAHAPLGAVGARFAVSLRCLLSDELHEFLTDR